MAFDLFFFFLLLSTSCFADTHDCCKTKSVGGVEYVLSREFTQTESQNNKLAECLTNCVFRKKDSPTEFCFASGDLEVECTRMSDETVERNALIVAENVTSSMTMFTDKLSKLDNFTTVEDKLDWALLFMPELNEIPVETGQRVAGPLADKAEVFMKKVDADIEKTGDNSASINGVLDNHLKQLMSTPEEDGDFQELQAYALQASKAMVKFSSDESEGGNGGADLFFKALTANTVSSNLTMEGMMRTRGWFSKAWKSVKKVVKKVVKGAIKGCLKGLVSGGSCKKGAAKGAASSGKKAATAEARSLAKSSTCFAGDSLVETTIGQKKISELVLGDSVLTSQQSVLVFTKFLGWLDRSSAASSSMLEIKTQNHAMITLSGSHLIFSNGIPRYARELEEGDSLMHWNGSSLVDVEILHIRHVISHSGFWAPLTTAGTLLVDGFLASCYASFATERTLLVNGFLSSFYASFPHQVSDLFLSPVKMMPRLLLDDEVSQHEDGLRSYVQMLETFRDKVNLDQEMEGRKNNDPSLNSMMSAGIFTKTEL